MLKISTWKNQKMIKIVFHRHTIKHKNGGGIRLDNTKT